LEKYLIYPSFSLFEASLAAAFIVKSSVNILSLHYSLW